jgi:RHS repeat-associated protein
MLFPLRTCVGVLCLLSLVFSATTSFGQAFLFDTTQAYNGPRFGQWQDKPAKDSTQNSANAAPTSRLPQVIPPSPTAASLGRWAESPVSPYTGAVQTNLPLYTVREGELTVPIALNFHHGGVRVEEEATWVGLGWSLDAGGVITRTIRGTDDLNQDWGYAFNTFPQGFTLGDTGPEVQAYYSKYRQYQQELDTEPDLFYYNVGGLSGKFILEAKSPNSFPLTGIPLDRSNVKITCEKLAANNYRWTIVTPASLTYTFEAQEVTASAQSVDNTAQNHQSTGNYTGFNYSSAMTRQVSAWYLSHIASPNQAGAVNFEYYTDKLYSSTSRLLFSETYKELLTACATAGSCQTTCAAGVGSDVGDRLSSLLTVTQNQYLKSIRFTNGRVDFETEERADVQPFRPGNVNATWPFYDVFGNADYEQLIATTSPLPTNTSGTPQRLKSIKLRDAGGSLLNQWNLSYSYFGAGNVNQNDLSLAGRSKTYNRLRLRLDAVQEAGSDGTTTVPPFSFTYVGDFLQNGKLANNSLPSKVSAQRDLFGYYNAYVQGIDRSVNDDVKATGTLAAISYPTGGRREFLYESNEAFGGKGDVDETVYAVNAQTPTRPLSISAAPNTYLRLEVAGQCAGPNNGNPNVCNLNAQDVLVTLSSTGGQTLTTRFGDMGSGNCSSPTAGILQCTYSQVGTFTTTTGGDYTLSLSQPTKFTAVVRVLKYQEFDYKTIKVGGLRVAQIMHRDGLDAPRFTYYTYTKDDGAGNQVTSGVQLTPLVKYSYGYLEQQKLEAAGGPNPNPPPPASCQGGQFGIIISARSLSPLGSSLGGQHVGYSRVVEQQGDGQGQTSGSTIHEFLNEPLNVNRNYSYWVDAPVFPSYGNGMPTRQTYVDQQTGLSVKEVIYTPTKGANSTSQKGLLLSLGANANVALVVNPFYYEVRSEHWYNQTVTNRHYIGTAYTDQVTSYTYANPTYLFPTRQTQSESRAESLTNLAGSPPSREIETTFTYPFDVPGNATLAAMVSRNQLAPVISQQTNLLLRATNGSLARVPMRTEGTVYAAFAGDASTTRYRPASLTYAIGTGPTQAEATAMTYDGRGNLTSYRLQNGTTTGVGYFGTATAGKADLPRTVTTGGGTDGTLLARSTYYDYVPGRGLASTTALSGVVTRYAYDALGRLAQATEATTPTSATSAVLAAWAYHYPGEATPAGIGATPTNTLPYVVTRTARLAQTTLGTLPTQTQTSIGYMDGLGRPRQTVGWLGWASQGGDLLLASTGYDGFGRAVKQWLPTPAFTTTGSYETNTQTLAGPFYGDQNPYNETVLERAPTNRPTQQFGPGEAFRNPSRPVQRIYSLGGGEVQLFTVNGNTLDGSKTYPTSSLYSDQTINERGAYQLTYTDKQGRVVARSEQRTIGDFNSFMITGYAYDDLGQLRYVIPPAAYSQFGGMSFAPITPKALGITQPDKQSLSAINGPGALVGTATAGLIPSTTDNSDLVREGIYAYRYDSKGRLTEKHVPGGGWQRIVYDKHDRPVLTQDDSDNNRWKFTHYDALSRPVRMGLLNTTDDQTTLQTAFDGLTAEPPYEAREDWNTSQLYYTNRSFPFPYKNNLDPTSVSYYDDYGWHDYGALPGFGFQSANAFNQPQLTATTGLMTGSLVRNLETADWYRAVSYYDYRGRVIQGFSQSVRGTTDRTDMAYRFNGELLQVRSLRAGIGELTTHTYDHLGRKLVVDHQLNSGSVRRIASYQYDAVGRLRQKQLGGSAPTLTETRSFQSGPWTSATTWQGGNLPGSTNAVVILNSQSVTLPGSSAPPVPQQQAGLLLLRGRLVAPAGSQLRLAGAAFSSLQSVDYSWHIRGGLKGLNTDPVSGTLQAGKLFAMKLGYEEDGQVYFDGNIRSQQWRSGQDAQVRSYTYDYDGASRLTGASGSAGVVSLSNLTYDANGNLLTLNRAGVDALTYSYSAVGNTVIAGSNKLTRVSDGAGNTQGFSDGNTTGDDYAYYADGSLSKDLNKGISSIEYNYLKLPRRITIGSSQTLVYQYDAAGTKLRKIVTSGSTTTTTDYVGNQVWVNNQPYQLAHEEGRIANISSTTAPAYRYEWSLVDHLGNNRVSFADNGSGGASVVQQQHYDPWGWELPGLGMAGSPVNRYTYLNREAQQETGWQDLMARQYDKVLGRFHSLDPVTEGQEHLSLFQYGWNNPVLKSDPDGLYPDGEPCCGGNGALSVLRDVAMGAAVAYVDDQTGVNLRGQHSAGRNTKAYNLGQDIGDVVSMVISAGETAQGLLAIGSSGIGEVATVGAATPVALPLAAGGAILVGHGTVTGIRAADNLRNQSGRVNASSTGQESHQTYTKTNPQTGQTYSGRTKGTGTPEQNVARRDAGHHMSEKGFGRAKLDQTSSNKKAIRGREQQLIDKHGGSQSKGGTSGNAINGISDKNPKRKQYLDAANKEFGPL